MNPSQQKARRVAESQCGPEAAVILLRQAVIQVASGMVGLGRLTLFSDYRLSQKDYETLCSIEEALGDGLHRLGEFERHFAWKLRSGYDSGDFERQTEGTGESPNGGDGV